GHRDDPDPPHPPQDEVQRGGPAELLPRQRDLPPALRGTRDPAHHAAPGGDALAPHRAHSPAGPGPHAHADAVPVGKARPRSAPRELLLRWNERRYAMAKCEVCKNDYDK